MPWSDTSLEMVDFQLSQLFPIDLYLTVEYMKRDNCLVIKINYKSAIRSLLKYLKIPVKSPPPP